MAHKILVSAPVSLYLIGPLNWVWLGWGWGVWGQRVKDLGLTIMLVDQKACVLYCIAASTYQYFSLHCKKKTTCPKLNCLCLCKIVLNIFPDWRHCAALSILRCHLPGGCPRKLHCHLHCVHFQENAGEQRPQLTAFTRNCWLVTYKEYCQAQRSNALGMVNFLSGTKTIEIESKETRLQLFRQLNGAVSYNPTLELTVNQVLISWKEKFCLLQLKELKYSTVCLVYVHGLS